MDDFRNIGLIVTENTATTATAQIAVLVNFRRAEGGGVEAHFDCEPGVVEQSGSLRQAVEVLLERRLPAAWVARRGETESPEAAGDRRRRVFEQIEAHELVVGDLISNDWRGDTLRRVEEVSREGDRERVRFKYRSLDEAFQPIGPLRSGTLREAALLLRLVRPQSGAAIGTKGGEI